MRILFAALLAATPVLAQPHSRMSPEDQKALHDYDLTVAKTDKMMAVGKKMREYADKHPEVEKRGDIMRGKTLEETIKGVEAQPDLVSLMKSEGVTPREFVLGMMSMMSAGMWAAMSKQYPDAKPPPEVNPRNVKLLEEHPEIMQKWQQSWSGGRHHDRGAPPHGGDSGSDSDSDSDSDSK